MGKKKGLSHGVPPVYTIYRYPSTSFGTLPGGGGGLSKCVMVDTSRCVHCFEFPEGAVCIACPVPPEVKHTFGREWDICPSDHRRCLQPHGIPSMLAPAMLHIQSFP